LRIPVRQGRQISCYWSWKKLKGIERLVDEGVRAIVVVFMWVAAFAVFLLRATKTHDGDEWQVMAMDDR
jgi:hypothetical protein